MSFRVPQSKSMCTDRADPRLLSYQTLKQKESVIRMKFSTPWIKDEESKACFLCRKEFNFLYRRKHHCRKCGQVFCSACSDYFLSQLIDPSNHEIDKESRLCQTCYEYCKEFIDSDINNNLGGEEDSLSSDENEESEQLRVVNRVEFKGQFEAKLKGVIRYVFLQEKKLSNVPQFGDQNIEQTFLFVYYCLTNLKLRQRRHHEHITHRSSSLGSQNTGEKTLEKFSEMDINRYVMIRTCLHKDSNQFTYISGIISSKNVAKKNMCISFGHREHNNQQHSQLRSNSNNASFDSTNGPVLVHNNPSNPDHSGVRCMVISVAVDIYSFSDNNYPDLDQVITKQRAYVQRIVEGIKQLKPAIIFCKENVNQDVLSSLESAGISVVQKIKPQTIVKIAECAKCHIVDDIAILLPQSTTNGQHKHNLSLIMNYIGNLQSAYFKTLRFATNQKTFMFLEQPEKSVTYHVSLLITGPQLEILKQFKKSLQVILRLARHLYIEQEIIYMNNEMIKGNKKSKKLYIESLENDVVDFGNLNNFIDDKLGLKEFLYSDLSKFSYVKLQYKKAEWELFDGVPSKEDFEKYQIDRRINYDNTKIHTLVKYCGEYEHEQVSFYQVKDQSLASFLMSMYTERNTACGTCQRPMFNHYTLYVRQKSYVKISIVERMDPNINKQVTQDPNNATTKTQNNHPQTQSNRVNPQQTDQKSLHQNSSSQKNLPSKTHKKFNPKDQILTYILCEVCHTNLTTVQAWVLGKTLMDYSYNRFIQHMFQEYSENFKQERLIQLKDIKDKEGNNNNKEAGQSTFVQVKCSHQQRSRVFNFKEAEIKFQCGRNVGYVFNKVVFASESVSAIIKDKDIEYYTDQFNRFKGTFKQMLQEAHSHLQALNDLITLKKSSKLGFFLQVQEMYKNCLDRMESEKEYALSTIEPNKILNYRSLIILYILEQRLNIGLHRLNSLQKELAKKKYRNPDDSFHSDQIDLNLIEDEFQEIDQSKTSKDYQISLNVQEDRHKDDEIAQPFEYIPVYAKNYPSMLSWSLNTKQYSRYLKESGELSTSRNSQAKGSLKFEGLGQLKLSKAQLSEFLRLTLNDNNVIDEKQIIEDNKLVIKLTKTIDIEILAKYEAFFMGAEMQKTQSQAQIPNIGIQDPAIYQLRSESDFTTAHSHNSPAGLQLNKNPLIKLTPPPQTPKGQLVLTKVQSTQHVKSSTNFDLDLKQKGKSTSIAVNPIRKVSSSSVLSEITKEISMGDKILDALAVGEDEVLQDGSYKKEEEEQEQGQASLSDIEDDQSIIASKGNLPDSILPSEKSEANKDLKDNLNGLFFKAPTEAKTKNAHHSFDNPNEPHYHHLQNTHSAINPTVTSTPAANFSSNNYDSNKNQEKNNTSLNSHLETNLQLNFGQQTHGNDNLDPIPENNKESQQENTPNEHKPNVVKKEKDEETLNSANQEQIKHNRLSVPCDQPKKHPQLLNRSVSPTQTQHENIFTSPNSTMISHQHRSRTHQNSSRVTHMSLMGHSSSQSYLMSQSEARGSEQNIGGMLGMNFINEKISEVTFYFAKQFEAFRNMCGISLERTIESFRAMSPVKLPGGQTQSSFMKSHDELFIIKEVSPLEFFYFLGFAPQYFQHVTNTPNSLLAKIYGMYEIKIDGEKHYFSIMENLFYEIDRDNCQCYDLKGSKKRRFTKNQHIGLDTNLMIDMNCEPFFIDNSSYQHFDKTIRADSDFLAQQQIVDYSLLLIADKEKKTLRIGIIDYFRKFDLQKLLEKNFKGLIYGEDPTIIEPKKYQERFVKTLTRKFFCKI